MQQKKAFWEALYHQLASVKLTVILLLALAVGSLLGTLLPQGLSPAEVAQRFGEETARWINILGLANVFQTTWFQMLLVLLAINLVVCTLDRLPKTRRRLRHSEKQITPERLEKFSLHRELKLPGGLENLRPRLEQVISREFAPLKPVEGTGSYGAVSEKGRWSPWMVYVVHLSVLLVLAGALVGSLFGFKGFMTIPENEQSSQYRLRGEQRLAELPFTLRLDNFDVTYYETGAPEEYRSDITVLENGEEVMKSSVLVNDPFTYRGITLYQSTFGSDLATADVQFTGGKPETAAEVALGYGETVALPNGDKVHLMRFARNFSGFGPALAIAVLRQGEEPVASWVLADRPGFHGNEVGGYKVEVKQLEQRYYSGFQVRYDPGTWIVYTGFTLMILGMGLTFYSSHRKLWIWADEVVPGTTRMMLAGRSSKKGPDFERDFERLCEDIRKDLAEGEKEESNPS